MRACVCVCVSVRTVLGAAAGFGAGHARTCQAGSAAPCAMHASCVPCPGLQHHRPEPRPSAPGVWCAGVAGELQELLLSSDVGEAGAGSRCATPARLPASFLGDVLACACTY